MLQRGATYATVQSSSRFPAYVTAAATDGSTAVMGNDEPLATTSALHVQQREMAAAKARAQAAEPGHHTLESILELSGLEEYAERLTAKSTLDEMLSRLKVNRPHFLEYVRDLGVGRLNARQKLANAIAKADRAGQLPAPTIALPHLKPPLFEEDDQRVTVRLSVPSGATTNQLKMTLDATSLRVEYCGGPTAARGKLTGRVVPAETDWEVERSARPEYDPLLDATEQPALADDTMILTLAKQPGSGRWSTLFSDAVAHRIVPPPPAEDANAKAVKAEWEKHKDLRRNQMLFGKPITPMPPKPAAVRHLEERERVERQRRIEKRRVMESHSTGDSAGTQGSLTAKEHWQPASALYLWREGLVEVRGAPDHPEDCPPLYTWREDRYTLVLRASTAAGRTQSELRLEAGSNYVDCLVGGLPTPWCGVLCGKIDASKCTLTIEAGGHADCQGAVAGSASVCDTLTLTLHKATPAQLWRAPWPELLPQIEARETRRARLGDLPRREWLTAGGGGYDELQSEVTWTLTVPLRAGNPKFTHDDLRVGVTAETLNVHVVGMEDTPLVGGELRGRIVPNRCSWKVVPAATVGGLLLENLEVTLVKEMAGSMWRGLLRAAYS